MHRWAALLLLIPFLLAGCAPAGLPIGGREPEPVRIGFAIDTLQDERRQRDRDLFVKHARELGAEVIVQAAGGDEYLQMAQLENLLTRGVDVLVVAPDPDAALGPMVDKAHEAGVKVIAYDRIPSYSDVDFYVTFDRQRIGELQALYLISRKPAGTYLYLGGSAADYSALLLRRGVMNVLLPYRQAEEIRLVGDEMLGDGGAAEVDRQVALALEKADGHLDAIIAADDTLAAAAVEALRARGKGEGTLVVGQDPDLAALRRVLEGTQAMTVYRPIRQLATRAAEAAVSLARGEDPLMNSVFDSGWREVPTLLVSPVSVDAYNLAETVADDGYYREEDLLRRR